MNKGVIGITRMVVVKYLKACCCRHTFLLILVFFSLLKECNTQVNQQHIPFSFFFFFSRFSHLFFCSWRRDLFSFSYIFILFKEYYYYYYYYYYYCCCTVILKIVKEEKRRSLYSP